MSNLSPNGQLLGNLEHTAAELLESTVQERGRGFASDNESWAEIKGHLERAKKMAGDVEKSPQRNVGRHQGPERRRIQSACKRADARRRCDGGGMGHCIRPIEDRR